MSFIGKINGYKFVVGLKQFEMYVMYLYVFSGNKIAKTKPYSTQRCANSLKMEIGAVDVYPVYKAIGGLATRHRGKKIQ